ncbi:hypothetical protein M427DRAFT_132683 [Gonapodya prolifera JEL478]|uniref:Extracellular membrane protein CFEM domain-containing protein n=1 Tax=Gonapodya prolifera (strain JEL478) TaxID=1344416 RepID=A0A139APW9_GONPJ|nr:hypothetical protein M427DRAFT_132683 [Gonapodya prolifera JEL478]|eukprot:KXS18772.1 hypothetical protein M427DRAFT_132683 [Gonapodya prolifera JEL478]
MATLSSFFVFMALCLLATLIQQSKTEDNCPLPGKWTKRIDAACSWYHNKCGTLSKFCGCTYNVKDVIGSDLQDNGLQGREQDGVYCFSDHVPFWQTKKHFDNISC